MNTKTISVTYSCKFNDPQKRYMNHNYGAEATAELEPGEDAEAARQKLAADLEIFVSGRRSAIYLAAELEEQFKNQKRDFNYAVDNVRRYEEGTRQANQEMVKANKLYEGLEEVRNSLSKLGVSVDMPKPCIDLPAAKPALPAADPEEEGNDPDDALEANGGID